jgi:pyridoxamine 5'-phosphate oxidase family protein
MSSFTTEELSYLLGERRLGRLATIDLTGLPHVVPVGMWRYNPNLATIDVSGRDFAATRKFRNVQANPMAAFIVDDLASVQPWRPRAVMVQGHAVALMSPSEGDGDEALIRITPEKVISWGLSSQDG